MRNTMKKTLTEEYKIADSVKTVVRGDKEIVDFARKWEDFVMETIKKANELHIEGSELHAADAFKLSASKERNRFLLARLGSLKAIQRALLAIYEQARKEA